MKEEHEKALKEGRTLYCPNGHLSWEEEKGYMYLNGVIKIKKKNLSWEEVGKYYNWFDEKMWSERL